MDFYAHEALSEGFWNAGLWDLPLIGTGPNPWDLVALKNFGVDLRRGLPAHPKKITRQELKHYSDQVCVFPRTTLIKNKGSLEVMIPACYEKDPGCRHPVWIGLKYLSSWSYFCNFNTHIKRRRVSASARQNTGISDFCEIWQLWHGGAVTDAN